ncbi:hypothetical protein CC85DRAFT_285739 [Cutaneotrichosporon oleaginosum]|uniref:Uncharacterized protein n=1 Tax=Cutaneotrichosporon oleaginosum TaxID=879819 RepID=A0A0J0XM07_9TREE|nr:uncharacterized protein CC85DRAFT_285739 [Cutaneotrichosporon oleaginosum]KLT42145.1 hypothetical protein CC85DRAFT_285739 [Cutaneotrichosporon oleaginosum]TXT11730.1 hypothetical protein COLE_02140 [Cutaneotrichosporon oleaginosum]
MIKGLYRAASLAVCLLENSDLYAVADITLYLSLSLPRVNHASEPIHVSHPFRTGRVRTSHAHTHSFDLSATTPEVGRGVAQRSHTPS